MLAFPGNSMKHVPVTQTAMGETMRKGEMSIVLFSIPELGIMFKVSFHRRSTPPRWKAILSRLPPTRTSSLIRSVPPYDLQNIMHALHRFPYIASSHSNIIKRVCIDSVRCALPTKAEMNEIDSVQ